ncbi:MAG: tetratricopeptide repeat protein [Planctomycetes bacterium]|nr:tetratricopeptide repeat protein [Planctomycetota bacterium]
MRVPRRIRALVVIAAVLLAVLILFARPLLRQYRLTKARDCLRARQTEEALVWLKAIEATNPDDGEVQFLMARALRRQGACDSIPEHLEKARKLGVPSERLERERWLVLAQSGQLREAELHLDELLADPQGDAREICEAFVSGYLRAYRFGRASDLLRAWEADFPEDPQPLFWRGRICQHLARDRQALALSREALDLAPDRVDLRLELATLLADRHEFEEAEEHFQRCAGKAPDNPDVLVGWGNCLAESRQIDQSRALFLRALEENPSHFEALYGLGRLESRAGNKDEAVKWLQLALQQDSRHPRMRFALASALQATGQSEAAKGHYQYFVDSKRELEELDKLMDRVHEEPDLVDLRYEIGMKYMQYVSAAQGAVWLHSVLDMDPSHVPAHEALAAYYAEQTRPDLAEKHRRLALASRDVGGDEQPTGPSLEPER